ncbi:hypothetical protein DWB68_14640 [Galactobacter valiniphilus]|uniref:Uncharacterized protein n=1 Tax=Galactobacter valiniphilus TaxID=2676122 RepID=A0A399J975_9MICC|nr:hypothetical protein DWB68_14640 [Galactobacter valiniphilus]
MKSDDIDYGWFEETLADLGSHVERWPLLAFSARIATELEDGELELELARRAGRDIGIDADLAATSTRRVLPLIAPAPPPSERTPGCATPPAWTASARRRSASCSASRKPPAPRR